MMVVRTPTIDVAFAGGVDLAYTRRDAPLTIGDWQSGTSMPAPGPTWPKQTGVDYSSLAEAKASSTRQEGRPARDRQRRQHDLWRSSVLARPALEADGPDRRDTGSPVRRTLARHLAYLRERRTSELVVYRKKLDERPGHIQYYAGGRPLRHHPCFLAGRYGLWLRQGRRLSRCGEPYPGAIAERGRRSSAANTRTRRYHALSPRRRN